MSYCAPTTCAQMAAVGWELNNIPTNYTHLEAAEIATAKSLKALRPQIKIGVSRNTAVVTTFWDSARKVMSDPTTQDYWLLCGNRQPCTQKWGLDEPCPPPPPVPSVYRPEHLTSRRADGPSRCDRTSYLFNWSNPRLQDWVRRYQLLADTICFIQLRSPVILPVHSRVYRPGSQPDSIRRRVL